MKSLFSILILFLMLGSPSLQAQHLIFAPLGPTSQANNLEVWKQCQGTNCTFVLKTDMAQEETGFGFSLTSTFEADKMLYSILNRYESGKDPVNAGVKWNGNAYQVVVNGAYSVQQQESIETSLTSLFFEEPQDIKWVFVEVDGEMAPLAQTAAHTFEVTRADGERYQFMYERGICHLMVLENEHGSFAFRLQSVQGTAHSMVK